MRYRSFGKTDLTTSEVGFGCARIGGIFQDSSRAEIVALLQRAADDGITFFDTADMYTHGESERLVGEAFHGRRDRVVIATKFGYGVPSQKLLIGRLKPLLKPVVSRLRLRMRRVHASVRGGTAGPQDFSPAAIIRAAENSLRRLRTDYIDVYQLHDPSVQVLERGEFIEPLERLRQQGKIRYWGVAGQSADEALAGLAHPTLDCIQIGLSVLEQAALDAAIPQAAERGRGVIARQVLASGLLTRKLDSLRLEEIDVETEVAARKRDQLAVFASLAERAGRNRVEMALQFALAYQEVSVVLLGISRSSQLDASLQALQAAELTAEERDLLIGSRRPGR
jgi:aryl-alcohol dehydrogenase-like predicted oxidoreductase